MESPRHPFRGHLPLAYTWPRPQAQPGGIAGWGMSGRAGKESDPRTSPAGGGQGPEGPSSLPPLWQSSASWAGWTGFCGCPGPLCLPGGPHRGDLCGGLGEGLAWTPGPPGDEDLLSLAEQKSARAAGETATLSCFLWVFIV